MIQWQIVLNDQVLDNFTVLEGDKLTIGRSSNADVSIDNTSVSRSHASIEMRGGKYKLTDLNSRNGTFVNGVKIDGEVELGKSDRLQIGKFQLALSEAIDVATPPWALLRTQDGTPSKDAPEDIQQTIFIASRRITAIQGKTMPNQLKLKGKEEYAFGKDDTCDVQITGWRASKIKFSIKVSATDHFLEPSPGYKPPTLNGKKVSEKVKLKSGDIIGIGGSKVKFE